MQRQRRRYDWWESARGLSNKSCVYILAFCDYWQVLCYMINRLNVKQIRFNVWKGSKRAFELYKKSQCNTDIAPNESISTLFIYFRSVVTKWCLGFKINFTREIGFQCRLYRCRLNLYLMYVTFKYLLNLHFGTVILLRLNTLFFYFDG